MGYWDNGILLRDPLRRERPNYGTPMGYKTIEWDTDPSKSINLRRHPCDSSPGICDLRSDLFDGYFGKFSTEWIILARTSTRQVTLKTGMKTRKAKEIKV